MKSDSSTTSQLSIFESSATYYNPATRRWDSGCFSLNKNHIQFKCNDSKNDQFHLCLPLSTITGLEKRQSNLIYPALVVCVGAEKHWFASFSSRDAVYNLLELFWRESLISKPCKKPQSSYRNSSSSQLGKELLNILHESENSLIETANALSDQSRQLYDAEEDVEDINKDLRTAEEALKSLSLPLTVASFLNNNVGTKESETRMQKYKVNFSFTNNEDKIDWEKGTLVITTELISLKSEENTVMQVTKDELEVFQVLSPWEFCLIHTFSGVQKLCYFMCPQLSRLLKFVTSISHYKGKIVYSDDDSSVYETASCSSRSSFGSAPNSPSSSDAHSSKNLDFDSDQAQVNSDTLSEIEFQELANVLQNLQTLATEVNKEQENQKERINALIENMENAELKMKKSNKDIKKMT